MPPSRPTPPKLPAAPTPFSPQKFYTPPHAPELQQYYGEEEGDWYAGVQMCGGLRASIIATTAAVIILGFPSQNTASQLITDEDYWQNSTAPVQQTFNYPQPFSFDQSEIYPQVTFQPDEDFYIVSVQQQYAPPPQLFTDPDEIPAGSLYGQPDEDFWLNWTPPVPQTFQWPNPWFHQDDPAGSLYAPPDEVAWQPIIQQQWSFVQPITDDVIIVPQPAVFQPDEDYWFSFSPFQAISYQAMPFMDSNEFVSTAVAKKYNLLMLMGVGT